MVRALGPRLKKPPVEAFEALVYEPHLFMILTSFNLSASTLAYLTYFFSALKGM